MGAVMKDVVWPPDGQRLGQVTEGFSVHAQHSVDDLGGRSVDVYTAWVYLGVEIIWHFTDDSGNARHAYDGLEDFAAYSFRRFSRRLADLLGTEN